MSIDRVCVYCASSEESDAVYREAAFRLGEILAGEGATVIYGGGATGSMGALAAGALQRGGRIIGVLPRFMQELEWAHSGLSELLVVETMRERKHLMLTGSNAVVALPGGCGTLEELFEAITLKRLAIYLNPVVLVNTRGFFDPCIALLKRCIEEKFMDPRHARMWTVVSNPEDVPDAIRNAPFWSEQARSFAALNGRK
ncbi:MAG: TIGR00730 family Rossman fold protein [Candidatus Korobacteraceae bacterium]